MAKIQPTAEQWKQFEQQLGNMHDPVFLDCDGFLVSFSLRRVEGLRLAITVGVNGWFKGTWLGWGPDREPSEEGRRFFQERTRSLYAGKKKAVMRRAFGKKESERKIVYRYPHWASAKSLRRHLVANNESIRVLTYEDYKACIDALPKEETETEAVA